jgi:AraC-like DNA-binding protein
MIVYDEGMTSPMNKDTLSQLLETFRLKAEIIFNAGYCGNWDVDSSGSGKASFHLVTGGRTIANSTALEEPVVLETGDFILFPQDASHSLRACDENDDSVELLCGHLHFSLPLPNPLIKLLPAVIVKQQRNAPANCRISALLNLLAEEASQHAAGSDVTINRLLEACFVFLVREHIANASAELGLAAALQDRKIAQSLDAMHARPSEPWNVQSLAEVAGMSRSSFAARFKALLAESPMDYLGRWRMQLAWRQLSEENATVLSVALSSGYETEAAFAKAFKRITGHTPGAVRSPNR